MLFVQFMFAESGWCRFAALPDTGSTATIHLQLCDLQDDLVESVLREDVAKGPQCRMRTGWLTQKEHSILQQHVKARFQVCSRALRSHLSEVLEA